LTAGGKRRYPIHDPAHHLADIRKLSAYQRFFGFLASQSHPPVFFSVRIFKKSSPVIPRICVDAGKNGRNAISKTRFFQLLDSFHPKRPEVKN